MENKPTCRICGTTESLLRCAKCKSAYYCSTSHQHTDWPNHKQQCRHLAKQKKELQLQFANRLLNSNNLNWPTVAPNIPNIDGSQLMVVGNGIANSVTTGMNGLGDSDVDAMMLGTSENEIMNSQAEAILSQNSIGNNYSHLDTNELPGDNRTRGYQIGRNDGNFILPTDTASVNERRYEDLCRTIINDMNTYGLSVVDDFLGTENGFKILNEVHQLNEAGVFTDGQLVTSSSAGRTIRGDKIAWVKGVETGCSNIGYLINQIDTVICRANKMNENGLLGDYKIRERTKAMVACYPGTGAHYITHVDNPNRDGRVITAIYYLNANWDTKRYGGILRIFPEQNAKGAVADIEPKFDRLIFFWSDRRNPHEVQPAHRTRYAITVWYFDAHEREVALNRVRQFRNNTKSNCS